MGGRDGGRGKREGEMEEGVRGRERWRKGKEGEVYRIIISCVSYVCHREPIQSASLKYLLMTLIF